MTAKAKFTWDSPMSRSYFLFTGFLFLCLSMGCGGGGGGSANGSAAGPYIYAELISFPTGGAPPGFVQSGFNSRVVVQVLNRDSDEPISYAFVSLNGTVLPYVAASEEYEGEINLIPGEDVVLSVTVGDATCVAFNRQFTSYPTITAPLVWESWSTKDTSIANWETGPPVANAIYAIGLLDLDGQLVWPSAGTLQDLPTDTTRYAFAPNSLTTGDRHFIVGLLTASEISGASAGSGLVIGGFNSSPVTVTTGPAVSLVSVELTPNEPALVTATARQFTVTGRYSNNTIRDLTDSVIWTSSDNSKATVDVLGLVTGTGIGSVTVTATRGSIIRYIPMYVYRPSLPQPLAQSVTYQIDSAHSGNAMFDTTLTFPGSPAWSVTLNGEVSYPLIADGLAFVTTVDSSFCKKLYALDERTGSVVWGPTNPFTCGGSVFAGHAYDQGKVFAIDGYLGLLRSFDARTGQEVWYSRLPTGYAYNSPPTAVNGVVYVAGSGTGGIVCAVEESNGNVLWTASVAAGGHSSPAVSTNGVFVSYPCDVYKFDPFTGSPLWHYADGCSGSSGKTAAYANGLLYVRENSSNEILDSATGTVVGNFSSARIPALTTQTGFFLNGGTLQSIDLSSHAVLWNFIGDGALVSAPIVINDVVIVGSASGNVYAVDASNGSQIWNGNAGSAIVGPNEVSGAQITGFGAGEGYLMVPAADKLTAWRISGS